MCDLHVAQGSPNPFLTANGPIACASALAYVSASPAGLAAWVDRQVLRGQSRSSSSVGEERRPVKAEVRGFESRLDRHWKIAGEAKRSRLESGEG